MTHKRESRVMSALVALVMLAALLVSLAGPARANHGDRNLEVTPEHQEAAQGTTMTLTAILNDPADGTSGTINIDFEHEGGANDPDGGTSRRSPDYTCDVLVGSNTCTVSVVGANPTGGTTTVENIRAWVDEDKVQTTVDADTEEGRYAYPAVPMVSEGDCGQANDNSDDCPMDEDPSPGVGCPDTVPSEPDCTDVVSVRFTRASDVATTLDCDDSGDEDTEREAKASDPSDDDVSAETITCTVRNQFNEGMNGVQVYGEVETPVNDPDQPDSASYDSPDYGCTTARTIPGPLGTNGRCTIDVVQEDGDLGKTDICFWAGDANSGASLCASEPTDENAAQGADTGNDLADQIEVSWEDPETFTLDCTPETDSEPAGATHEVTCTAISPTFGTGVSDVTIRFEVSGTGDSDATNSPDTPDASCTTSEGGSCTYKDTSTATGDTTYRAWIDDNKNEPPAGPGGVNPDPDRAEERDEAAEAGDTAEPDNTDVVENTWVEAPETLKMSPASDSAKVGACNPFTITVEDADGKGAQSAKIEVEQVHQKATNSKDGDEPKVSFCVPSSGPNPSGVDTSQGDRRPAADPEDDNADEEDPNNRGTDGGETVKETNAQGQITIGIRVTPRGGSDGSGTTRVTAFFDLDDNSDPDTDEPKDTSVKTWTGGAQFCPGHKGDSRKQIVGTSGPDVLRGGSGAEVICGLGGKDTLRGAGGKDKLIGGGGNDLAEGGGGADKVNGGGGDDVLQGNSGDDRIRGGSGNDVLNGGKQTDACFGGPGRDRRRSCEN